MVSTPGLDPPLPSSPPSLPLGQCRKYINAKTGSAFMGTVLREEQYGGHSAVVVQVSGRGHYLGEAKYWQEEEDKIGRGFL